MQLFAAAITLATEVELAPLVVLFVMSLVLPVVNGFLFKADASDGTKQAVGVVTAGVATLINVSLTDTGAAVFSLETLLLYAMQWATTILSYHGLYKPHHLNERTMPEVGIGRVRRRGARPLDPGEGPAATL